MKVHIRKKHKSKKLELDQKSFHSKTNKLTWTGPDAQLDLAGTYGAEFGRPWARLLWETQHFS